MFRNNEAFSAFSVDEVDGARAFYEGTLGLDVTEDNGMLALHLHGGGTILVYVKGTAHEPAPFPVLNFPVPDVAVAVAELCARGVQVLRDPGLDQDEYGVHHGEGASMAWFTDPAGNMLSVLEL